MDWPAGSWAAAENRHASPESLSKLANRNRAPGESISSGAAGLLGTVIVGNRMRPFKKLISFRAHPVFILFLTRGPIFIRFNPKTAVGLFERRLSMSNRILSIAVQFTYWAKGPVLPNS